MSASVIQLIGELTIAASIAIVIVAAVRRPLRRIGGARIAYLSWLLVPTSQLVVLLPAPSQPLQMTVDAIPQSLLGALQTVVSANLGAAGVDYAAIGLVGQTLNEAITLLALQEGRLGDARSYLQKALDAGGLTPEQATRVRDQATQQLTEAEGQ
jgi:beta-lactamase regulating signal transducer with metallopeptidase domain